MSNFKDWFCTQVICFPELLQIGSEQWLHSVMQETHVELYCAAKLAGYYPRPSMMTQEECGSDMPS
jgi:hypothetical protein